MLLLRGARAASAASTAVAAGASAGRCISIRLTAVAALSSGGRRRKGQRRGEAKPPSPSPLPPPPQPLPRHGKTQSSKKKSGSSPSFDAKKNRPAELEQARGPRSPERGEARKGGTQQQLQEKAKAKRAVRWKCASGCGACCKLDKGPDFPTPDEIFADHPDDLQLYRSMTGDDGWCINYDKATRTCNIYQDRPSFCRVEPKVFDEFFGVPRSRFDREACSACLDNIKMVYGDDSAELSNFKRVIRDESKKMELEASKNQDKLLDT
ncbi:hypothetical protein GQ55_9G467500 [Panicum hallii var. hallii]|uniref:Uncharacterized protein n=1 Tax=Panicum hallii var. hallii TaxID=1504633 RepID=A0A2T7CCD7_9POAL|nr:hypothetical protein GQ55_9G467500 [Panicum hallii var. hallii]PUZ40994.1 hypothetical protein GQ55_9G467500 [Panicum hallii var. hallii]